MKSGKKITMKGRLARALGVSTRQVDRMGGPVRIAAMSRDALQVMLNQTKRNSNVRAAAD